MKKSLQNLAGIAALTLCGFSAQAATLSVLPSTNAPAVGSIFSVTIAIADLVGNGAPSLADFDIDIHFDANVLAYTSFTWGDSVLGDQLDLAQLGSLAFADESGAALGHLNYFEVSYDDSAVLNLDQADSFGLLTLTFTALTTGVSPIAISINALGDASGNALSAQIVNAGIAVAEVPLPPALPLLASALLLVGGARSRRNK
jgi:hypothetical protein